MDKVFHVFVSSTYSDLIDERKKVSEAVAKAGYVAEGMEIFPASSQRQMDFIQRVIDRCDYYILIIAGRYGSISEDGISYTEKEFRYAVSKNIPVLAFIRSNLEDLTVGKTEKGDENKKKLDILIDNLKNNTMVDFWSSPDELSTKALAALSQARVSHEGVGWIRADKAANNQILSEINELRKENSKLKIENDSHKSPKTFDDIDLASMDEEFKIRLDVSYGYGSNSRRSNKEIVLTWREILACVGSNYRTPSNASGINTGISRAAKNKGDVSSSASVKVEMEDREKILMQMEALGLMSAKILNLKTGGSAVFHQLTDQGLAVVLRENVVKSSE